MPDYFTFLLRQSPIKFPMNNDELLSLNNFLFCCMVEENVDEFAILSSQRVVEYSHQGLLNGMYLTREVRSIGTKIEQQIKRNSVTQKNKQSFSVLEAITIIHLYAHYQYAYNPDYHQVHKPIKDTIEQVIQNLVEGLRINLPNELFNRLCPPELILQCLNSHTGST